MFFSLFFGFLLGAVAVVAAEGLAVYWILRSLSRKKEAEPPELGKVRDLSIEQQPLTYPYEKQGVVWVLEPDKLSKSIQGDSQTKGSKDRKNRKEIMEVFPVKKHGKIKEHCLILTDLEGDQTTVQLLDCSMAAVSASNLSSRKWMKKYPIKVESKDKIIYNGSNVLYLYLETSWEKESWCKALRLASCSDLEKFNWYNQLGREFHSYLSSLSCGYPLFSKPSMVPSETTDKSSKPDQNSSKVRHFLKKIKKKASMFGTESKPSILSSSIRGERKVGDKKLKDSVTTNGHSKSSPAEESTLQDLLQPSFSSSTLLGSLQGSTSCDAAGDEKFGSDEGTLCLNLLFSRLFFDLKRSKVINNLIKERVQKTLSNMRTPSFVGGITCTGLDLGNLPPYLHSMRVLPTDMNEGWAVEVEIEYSGGFLLDIETRLDVREPEFQKSIVSTSLDSSSTGEVASAFIEDLDHYGHESNLSTDSDDGTDRADLGIKTDLLEQSGSGSWTSRWKTIVNSVADHVSQVPISLTIRVASLRGVVRLSVKPPPSDQLWICFTSMPLIDLKLNSSVGDRRISSTHAALLIANRFKAAIRESLVLPNCDSICIPWMLAEKDDWVPLSVAPFFWVCRENSEFTGKDASRSQPVEHKINSYSQIRGKTGFANILEHDDEETCVLPAQPSLTESVMHSISSGPTLPVIVEQSISNNTLENLRVPLLGTDDTQKNFNWSKNGAIDNVQTSTVIVNEETAKTLEKDTKIEEMGTREQVKDLGKKSEKFDEKICRIVENVSMDAGPATSVSVDTSISNSTVEDSRIPLLRNDDGQKSGNHSRFETSESSQLSTATMRGQTPKPNEDDIKVKKMGRKERMKDLGKKVSEKFDEKIRHIVENVSTDIGSTFASADQPTGNIILDDSRMLLLTNDMPHGAPRNSNIPLHGQIPKLHEEEPKTKKMGTRERMWDLGKKMSEKFDEKRRHIEEKGRHVVEKMKENARSSSEGIGSSGGSTVTGNDSFSSDGSLRS